MHFAPELPVGKKYLKVMNRAFRVVQDGSPVTGNRESLQSFNTASAVEYGWYRGVYGFVPVFRDEAFMFICRAVEG